MIYFFIQNINCQCNLDVGNDVFLCVDKFGDVANKPVLNAKINSGTPPFKIKWTFAPNSSTSIFSNDSILNPILNIYYGTHGNKQKLSIYLTVIDSNGFKCTDSIIGLIVKYAVLPDLTTRTIKLGDTIQIYSLVGGGIGKIIKTWSPNYNISDSATGGPLVWPRKTTTYYSTVIDSLGCKSSWNVSWTIYIDSTSSIIDFKKLEKFIPNYHNPIHENSIYEINDTNEIENIEIYNSISQKIFSTPSNKNLDIGKITSIKGAYYLVIQFKNKSKQSMKIIRE